MPEATTPIVLGAPQTDPEVQRRIDEARKGTVDALKGPGDRGVIPKPPVRNLIPQKGGNTQMPEVMRQGMPVSPRPPGSPILSPNTEKLLEKAGEALKKSAEAAEAEEQKIDPEKQAEGEFLDTLSAGPTPRQERIKLMARKKGIEERLSPLSFDDLLIKGEVSQKVPIIPGKLEATFRSLLPEESLFIKQFMFREKDVSDSWLLEKYSICQLACSLTALNDKPLQDHRDPASGAIDEKKFKAKLKVLERMSGYIIQELYQNYAWFDLRVKDLIDPDKLGNG